VTERFEKYGEPYGSRWEHMRELFLTLDYRLYLYYNCHRWIGPNSKLRDMLGVVVSPEEFEHNLETAAPDSLYNRVAEDAADELRLAEDSIRMRLRETPGTYPIQRVFERFCTDEFERGCVVLACAGEIQVKYAKMFGYLQDDISKKYAGVWLAVGLYMPSGGIAEEYAQRVRAGDAFVSLFDRGALDEGMLKLRGFVLDYIISGEPRPPKGFELFDGAADGVGELVTGGAVAERIDGAAGAGLDSAFVQITGAAGSGRRFQLKHWAVRSGRACLFADVSAAGADAAEDGAAMAKLYGAHLCLHSFEREREVGQGEDARTEEYLELGKLGAADGVTFLITGKQRRFEGVNTAVNIEVTSPDSSERLRLFTHYMGAVELGGDVSLPELAEMYALEPSQIKNAAEQADALIRAGEAADKRAMQTICASQASHNLDKLATRLAPRYSWDDIALPKRQLDLLRQACTHVTSRYRVFSEWGFADSLSYGKGLSILLSGPPGTGKTMCAQIIAGELNLALYRINISKIVSKYIGETEKNLEAVFSEAKKTGCILFFDECDAIFGKRSEVKDSHDRHANIEVAYLLQQIEEHDGVTLLSTNLGQNIDAAFMRRITYLVAFPFPDADARREIYIKTLPERLPVSDGVDWSYMAEKFKLSGGHIKNIVLSAAFAAADEGTELNMRHLLISAVREMKKNDIVVVREDFREYADLVFGELE
jgi:ATP-dependent 26S proteasome regulatory subunit